MTTTIRVLTLYPDLMDVYADRGNLMALEARARALGIEVRAEAISLGEALPAAPDLVLIGGGQDREQRLVAPDLQRHAPTLRQWAQADMPMLAVCGGFQLFGRWYRTARGEELPGVGIFDVTTVAPDPSAERCIGDVLIEIPGADGPAFEAVGFENHAGRTYLGPGATPLGRVLHGFGNNGDDGTEGAQAGEALGTYLHGPLLPKNPVLSNRLLLAAWRYRAAQHPEGAAQHPELAAQHPEGTAQQPDLPTPPPAPFAERAHRAAAAIARRRGRRNAASAPASRPVATEGESQ